MKHPALRIATTDIGDVTIVNLSGRLVLDDGDAVFRDAINDLVGRERCKLVVNLADVTYIDSAGVGVLVGRYLGVRRRGGDMKLANLTNRSHRVMAITQLLNVFEAFDSIDDAVRAFGAMV